MYNILIVGVGGQGTLLASRVLGKLADILGLDCKLSEVHGMAQRGGSVVTHVRMAKKVNSPILTEGDADIIIAFEKLEAIRYYEFLKKNGIMLINNQEISPMPVVVGDRIYPDNIYDTLRLLNIDFHIVDAVKVAEECGNIRTVNTVMIGLLAKKLKIAFEDIKNALVSVVPQKLREVNILALEKGYKL